MLQRPWCKLLAWAGILSNLPLHYFLLHYFLLITLGRVIHKQRNANDIKLATPALVQPVRGYNLLSAAILALMDHSL